VDLSGGLTLTAANNVLSAKTDAAAPAFTSVTIPVGAYTSGTALATAANAAIGATALEASVILSPDGANLVLQSKIKGTGSYIESGTGTFNTAAGLTGSFEMPEAAEIITAMSPPGGPLDMSEATIEATIGAGGTAEERDILIGSIAPRFVETDAFIKSFQVGMISGYRSADYNPDPSRHPALTPGPAVSVVQDDGTTPYEAPMTEITAAEADSPNTGDLTITGTNLGNTENLATVVRVWAPDGSASVQLLQKIVQMTFTDGTQGSVTPTEIVIPASLLKGLGVADATVRVQYTSFVSNLFTVT
jgi:hypothetical protein